MKASLLLIFTLAVILPAAAGAGLYRWVDAHGNVTYSDQVPPDHAGGGHTELDKTGIRVREIAPAMSEEEADRYRAEEAQRRAAQQRMERQREADLVLLRSYPTQDEIRMARNGKLNTYNFNIEVLFGQARREKARLLEIRHQVATRQRDGKAVSDTVTAEMTSAEQRLLNTYRRILDEKARKQATRDEYAGYLRRYRELKGLPPQPEGENGTTGPEQVTAIACTGEAECAASWRSAVAYLNRTTKLPVEVATDALVITGPPTRNGDVSLNLSRIPDEDSPGHWILLDLQCKATATGHETCGGEKSRSVVRDFLGAVTADAPHEAQTAPARTPPRPAPTG